VNDFICREKTPELTHRYAYALQLMDLLAEEINGSSSSSTSSSSGSSSSSTGVFFYDGGVDDTLNDSFEGSDEVGPSQSLRSLSVSPSLRSLSVSPSSY